MSNEWPPDPPPGLVTPTTIRQYVNNMSDMSNRVYDLAYVTGTLHIDNLHGAKLVYLQAEWRCEVNWIRQWHFDGRTVDMEAELILIPFVDRRIQLYFRVDQSDVPVDDLVRAIKQVVLRASPPSRSVYGAVRAWRMWRSHGGTLCGTFFNAPWRPGENVAPDGAREYGFYGFDGLHRMLPSNAFYVGPSFGDFSSPVITLQEMSDALRAIDGGLTSHSRSFKEAPPHRIVLGSCLQYGRVVKGQYGSRSSHAIPETLILPYGEDKGFVRDLAAAYNMRTVTLNEAATMPSGVNSPIPFDKSEYLGRIS